MKNNKKKFLNKPWTSFVLAFLSAILLMGYQDKAYTLSYEDEIKLIQESRAIQPATSKVKAKDFNLSDINGKSVSLKDLKGNIVFLNLWATWCPPCRREMPSMDKLNKKMQGTDFRMVAVSDESKSTVKKFAQSKKYQFPIYTGNVDGSYNTGAIPTTWIIDKEGYIIGQVVGSMDWSTDELTSLFKKLSDSNGDSDNRPAVIDHGNQNLVNYQLDIYIISGSKTGEAYKGSFSYDPQKIKGKGDEEIEVTDIEFSYLGKVYHRSDFDSVPVVKLKNGQFFDLILGGGSQTERFALNTGFQRSQFGRPSEAFIRDGKRYFGYLDKDTYVDGAGMVVYTITDN